VNKLTNEEKIDKWIEDHDLSDYCPICAYNDDCTRGMVCYGGDPVFPHCAGIDDITEILDTDAILEEMRGWA
jgi:hypothetical protein